MSEMSQNLTGVLSDTEETFVYLLSLDTGQSSHTE